MQNWQKRKNMNLISFIISWEGTVNSAMSYCTCFTYSIVQYICLRKRVIQRQVRRSASHLERWGWFMVIYWLSGNILYNFTNAVCIYLLARLMLCRSNSRKVSHRWGMVVRLTCGGQQGVWHHLILCVSKRSVYSVYLCCMLFAFVFSCMVRLGVIVSFLYAQKRLAYLFSFDRWEVVAF